MVLSPLSGWVLQGSLGGSPFSVYQKGEMLSNLKIMVFGNSGIFLGFSRGLSVVLSLLSGWVLQGRLQGIAGPFCRVWQGSGLQDIAK